MQGQTGRPHVASPSSRQRHVHAGRVRTSADQEDQQRDVQLEAGRVNWIAAQEHSGENIGTTESHAVFIELKEPPPGSSESSAELGPTSNS